MLPDAPPPIRVVLADDHLLVRSGIKSLLAAMRGVEVIAEASDGEELLQVLQDLTPDVVMTDLEMPGIDGIAATRQIVAAKPSVRVVVLSMFEEVDFAKRAVAAGACGYLLKGASAAELELALRSVVDKGRYFSPDLAQRLLSSGGATVEEQLTERQLQILVMLARGMSAKEIAYELGLSAKTVDVHRAQVMKRLELTDLASLTRYAVRKGLVKA